MLPIVLTIAGSDSGGGAGVQADARTIHALGGFATMALTAITAQNTRGVTRWQPVPARLIAAQIEAVLADLPVAAIKTGLLPGGAAIRAIGGVLERFPRIPLVVDPVIGSTSGALFLNRAGVAALRRELLPRATLITPNWPEAAALTQRRIKTFADAEAAAKELADATGTAILLKGGHGPDPKMCRDVLVTRDAEVTWFSSPRIVTRNTHGTGCVLSAAIATRLEYGASLLNAVADARRFLARALRDGRRSDWGGGAGPAFVAVPPT